MEVSGKKSESDIFCVGSNDGDGDIFCDPCENDGEMQPAEGFCEDCQEYLCSSCFKIHRRPVLWRHHVLLDKDAMPKTKTKEKLNFECTEPCVEHSTKIIEYYCQTHDQLGCPVCITGKHKTCNDVEYIPHIAERYGESSEMEGIFDSLEGLQKKADVYTCKANKEKLKVTEFEKEAKARVLQLRDEFNSICDRLKEEIDSVKRSDERKINDSIMKYEDISRKIKTRAGVLEKKRTEMKMSQLFTEAKLSKVSVVDLMKELDSTKENAKIQHYDIDFSVEALRSGLKLNFLDNKVDTDTEIEGLNPSGHQIKVSDEMPRRITDTGDKPEAQGNTFSGALELKIRSDQTAKISAERENINKQNVTALYTEEKKQFGVTPGYMKDTWTPLQTSGNIQYDREFLLQFRDCAYALQKPRDLPDIPNIVLDELIGNKSKETPNDFIPAYAWKTPVSKKHQSKAKSDEPVLSLPKKTNASPNEQSPLEVNKNTSLSKSKNSNTDLLKLAPENVSQQNVTFSPQTMTTRPPLDYPLSTINPHPPYMSNPLMLQTVPTQTIMNPYMSSTQTMTTRPPLHYPVSTINPHPQFGPNPLRLQTGLKQTIFDPYMTPQQRMQRPNFSFGVPNNHHQNQQFLRQQFNPPQFQPSLIAKATNDQRLEESQVLFGNEKHDKGPKLSIFDPVCGAGVTAGKLTSTEARGYQESASERNSAEMSKVGTMLNDLIVRRQMDNESVMEWIDSNVDATSRKRPHFIRALVTVVVNSAIKGSKGKERLEPREISPRNDLLQRYIEHDSELELQALYAIQALVTRLQHPTGILRVIFDTLYDEDLISEDAFFKWQMSEEEPDGKKTCLLQTRQFFTWLKEAEEDS